VHEWDFQWSEAKQRNPWSPCRPYIFTIVLEWHFIPPTLTGPCCWRQDALFPSHHCQCCTVVSHCGITSSIPSSLCVCVFILDISRLFCVSFLPLDFVFFHSTVMKYTSKKKCL
jgi:hypothetical protein